MGTASAKHHPHPLLKRLGSGLLYGYACCMLTPLKIIPGFLYLGSVTPAMSTGLGLSEPHGLHVP